MSKDKMKEVIKKFQEYLTENRKTLRKHCDVADEINCKWEAGITKQRIDDLFLVRYRLEHLLEKAGYTDLSTLAAFNEKARQKLEKK